MNTKEIFSKRFKSARLMKGYSLQDLANNLDNKLTRQALHRYEKGEVIPGSDVLISLGKALGVSPDYFFKDYNVKVELGNIKYFKIKS